MKRYQGVPGTTVSPEAHYMLLGGAIHSQRGWESLGDIWLLVYNECSVGQMSICHLSQEARWVRGIEGTPGHLEITFISHMLQCRCDSIRLDSDSAVKLSLKGAHSYWEPLTQVRDNWSSLASCFLRLYCHICQSICRVHLFLLLCTKETDTKRTPTAQRRCAFLTFRKRGADLHLGLQCLQL